MENTDANVVDQEQQAAPQAESQAEKLFTGGLSSEVQQLVREDLIRGLTSLSIFGASS